MIKLRNLCSAALLGLALVAGVGVTAQPALAAETAAAPAVASADTIYIFVDDQGNIVGILIIID